jgi:hypothetical protein
VQDLFGCRNLYGNAVSWLRHVVDRVGAPRTRPDARPLPDMTRAELRKVRAYAVMMPIASLACLGLAGYVWTHVILLLYSRAVAELVTHRAPLTALDGAVTVLVLSSGQLLWARAWWTRHGPRARRIARRITVHVGHRLRHVV